MAEKSQERISRRKFLKAAAGAVAGVALTRCLPRGPAEPTPAEPTPEPQPPEPPTPTPSPAPTKASPPEATPEPTVEVRTTGFGVELTAEEQKMASSLQSTYEELAREQKLAGTIVLTRGDKQGEIGAYFEDLENNPWSRVVRLEQGMAELTLEQVPFYEGTKAQWNPNEMRFEFLVGEQTFVYNPSTQTLINQEGFQIAEWKAETFSWQEIPPTPAPTETAPPEPTPTSKPEVQPSNEICDVEGKCYQRTRRRTGIKLSPDGTESPMGVGFCYRHTADPDRNFQGTWGVNGRIAQITNASRGEFRMNIGRDGETLLINVRMMHGQPDNTKNYQYARMRTFQYGVNWRVSTPEVRLRLGRDLVVGDYLEIGPYGICKNSLTNEQNYQRVIAAGTGGTVFTYRLEIIQ